MKTILLSDATLRDGNHAIGHQLSADQIAAYCRAADAAGIGVIEVGHGNGLGASSLQLGESRCPDATALGVARATLKTAKLGVHVIPGFATIKKDIAPAVALGVDVFRVASHCSEADLTQKHIEYVRASGRRAYGVLMMSHMVSPERLAEEAVKMQSYGAQGVVIMDSAGHYLPDDVTARVSRLADRLSVPVGFHAHDNLGMAIANSVAAVAAGASIVDGCARGFGAGAGNAKLEVLAAVLAKMGVETGVDLYRLLDAAELAERELMTVLPSIKSASIVSGMAGVFSGFLKPVDRIAREHKLDPRDLFFELGRRKVIAGQEDLILEAAVELARVSRRSAPTSRASQ